MGQRNGICRRAAIDTLHACIQGQRVVAAGCQIQGVGSCPQVERATALGRTQSDSVSTGSAGNGFNIGGGQVVGAVFQHQLVRTVTKVNVATCNHGVQCDHIGTTVAHNGFHVAGGDSVGAVGQGEFVTDAAAQVNLGTTDGCTQCDVVNPRAARNALHIRGCQRIASVGQGQSVCTIAQAVDGTANGCGERNRVRARSACDCFYGAIQRQGVGAIRQHYAVAGTTAQIYRDSADCGTEAHSVVCSRTADGLYGIDGQVVGTCARQNNAVSCASTQVVSLPGHSATQRDDVVARASHQTFDCGGDRQRIAAGSERQGIAAGAQVHTATRDAGGKCDGIVTTASGGDGFYIAECECVAAGCQCQGVCACTQVDAASGQGRAQHHAVIGSPAGNGFNIGCGQRVGRCTRQGQAVRASAQAVVATGDGGRQRDRVGQCASCHAFYATQCQGVGHIGQREGVASGAAAYRFSVAHGQCVGAVCQNQPVAAISQVDRGTGYRTAQCYHVCAGIACEGLCARDSQGVGAIGQCQAVGTCAQIDGCAGDGGA